MDPRKPPRSPAVFKYKSSQLDWRTIQTSNFQELLQRSNTLEIQAILKNLATADISEEEIRRFRGPALHRLFELTQQGVQLLSHNHSVPCPQCSKRFISSDFLHKHISRRHSLPSLPPEQEKNPQIAENEGFIQTAAVFLQEELQELREISEKQMEETINGMNFLLEQAGKLEITRNYAKMREKQGNKPSETLNLVGELAKTQQKLLEYELNSLKRSVKTPEPVSQPLLIPVSSTVIEEKPLLSLPRTIFSGVSEKLTGPEQEIIVEFSDSSQSQEAIQSAAHLIGFDVFEKPQYRYLAEELLGSEVPKLWTYDKTGVSILYKHTVTGETSLFHPNLPAFQAKYRALEQVKTVGAALRLQLVDTLPKIRVFEEKYDGRMMCFYAKTDLEIRQKREEMNILTINSQAIDKSGENYEIVKEKIRKEADLLYNIRLRGEKKAVLIEETDKNVQKTRKKQVQSSEIPLKSQSSSSSISVPASTQSNTPFSRYFQPLASTLHRQGTLIGAKTSAETWVSRTLRDISTISDLISKPDVVQFPVKSSFGGQFTDTTLYLELASRWNGVALHPLKMTYLGPVPCETIEIAYN